MYTYEYDEIWQKHAVLDNGSTPFIFRTEPHFGFLLIFINVKLLISIIDTIIIVYKYIYMTYQWYNLSKSK